MAQRQIKRYALVPERDGHGLRRFHLARVAPSSRSALGMDRLERMEEIAALDGLRDNGSDLINESQLGERTSISSVAAARASRWS